MMREMKDSGIAWVGDIPKEWELHPMYYYFKEHKHKNSLGNENNLLSLSYGKIVRKDINTNEGLLPESFNTYNIIDKGDIVLRLTDLQNDKRSLRTGLAKEKGIITSAYVTLRSTRKVDSIFFHYLLHSYDLMKVLYNMGSGVRQGLNYEELSKIMLIAPPLPEQQKIAAYLDSKCAEIDGLIADIQSQIDTLEQYKRSVISEAVTKSVDGDATMVDSNIDYIGLINSSWTLSRIGYICIKLNRGFSSEAEALICSNKGEVIIRGENNYGLVSDNDNMFQGVMSGDLLIHGMDTWHGAVAVSHLDGKCTTVVHVCDTNQNKEFVSYYLQMLAFKKVYKAISNGVRGNTSDFRSWDKVKKIYISLPDKDEQDRIAQYLTEKCSEISEIIKTKKEQISTLEAYKKSVIYEYVTGKKEVV